MGDISRLVMEQGEQTGMYGDCTYTPQKETAHTLNKECLSNVKERTPLKRAHTLN